MKKIFAIAALVCCSFVSFGQNKGDIALSANLNLAFQKDSWGSDDVSKASLFGIGAGASYFVIDNLSVGLSLSYAHNSYSSNSKDNQFHITPSIAYYIGICNQLYYRPTVSYSFGINKSTSSLGGDYKYNTNNLNIGIGVFEYRVRDHFAVTANVLNFMLQKQSESDYTTSAFTLTYPTLGIVYYL